MPQGGGGEQAGTRGERGRWQDIEGSWPELVTYFLEAFAGTTASEREGMNAKQNKREGEGREREREERGGEGGCSSRGRRGRLAIMNMP